MDGARSKFGPFLLHRRDLHFGRTPELIHLSQPALSLRSEALGGGGWACELSSATDAKTPLNRAGFAFRRLMPPERSRNWTGDSQGQAGCQWKIGTIANRRNSTAGNEIVPNIVGLV